MNALFDLTGKVALVTGSSRGIGLTLAYALGRAGATLILNDVDEERLKAAVAEVSEKGLPVYGFVFDVTSKSQIEEHVSNIENTVGPIDILVNNAGITKRGPLEEFDLSSWQTILDVNLTGVFLTSQAVAGRMIPRGRGKIINICSLQSELGRPTNGPYTASKGAVKMLTKAMTADWAKHNIQVNGIGPGYFITEMTKTLAGDEKFDAWVRARTPAGRWGCVDELGGAAVFFASRASDFVNGQILYVDGGLLSVV